ncbi:NAD(P)-binding protein [Aspergillus ellipticus CBS 707.79]|uniref:NAD(P)-binding protein n=1 Tax=Aspergillus ellipticus CBS 707.79 TaxID=1448320 RepID=A0A319CUN4_9EURO|nr:NAD(P)-binding protein [Aspergillus ellipticus CBS 707.79]
MPSYLITGGSRGIGWEFGRQLASNPDNTVIGLVRNTSATEKKVSEELQGQSNVHVVRGDITDYASLQTAVADTAQITGGSLDCLIANAGAVSHFDAYDPIGVLGEKPGALEEEMMNMFKVNVVGNTHLFNLFVPLIRKGTLKKVIAISSGQAALDMIPRLEIEAASVYATSKAALNTVVAKFSAQYAKEGILFLSICPGMVDTGRYDEATPEQKHRLKKMLDSFVSYAPHFKGPSTTETAIKDVLSVIDRAAVERGDGGTFVSHYGNKQWL